MKCTDDFAERVERLRHLLGILHLQLLCRLRMLMALLAGREKHYANFEPIREERGEGQEETRERGAGRKGVMNRHS